jgi:hypothetical protein
VFDYAGVRALHPADAFGPPDERSFREVELAPGDVLVLPPGAWHKASAVGHSLAINLALNYPLGRLPFFELLECALESQLTGVPGWRALPPPTVFEPGADAMPDEVSRWFAERLDQLRAVLDQLDPRGRELAHAWRSAVCATGNEGAPPAPAPRALRKDDVLSTPGPGLLYFGDGLSARGQARLMLYCAAPSLSVPFGEGARPFLRRLTMAQRFRAGDCLRWAEPGQSFPWSSVKEILSVLLDAGVVRREQSG